MSLIENRDSIFRNLNAMLLKNCVLLSMFKVRNLKLEIDNELLFFFKSNQEPNVEGPKNVSIKFIQICLKKGILDFKVLPYY